MRIPIIIISLLLSASFLQGCAPAMVATAGATGVLLAGDRRNAETILLDQSIEMRANDAIYSDPFIGTAVHVNVVSYNGRVLLTGEVPSPEVRDKVVNLVSKNDKIATLHNEIVVGPNSDLAARNRDAMITANVKAYLLRNTEVDPTKVKVITESGNIYLMGLVTEEEAEKASYAASQISGVKRVVRAFEYISEGGDTTPEIEEELDPELQEDNSLILEKIDEIMTQPRTIPAPQ